MRKNIKYIEKYCQYCHKVLERKRYNGVLEDFTIFKKRKYCNRECMRKAYLKVGINKKQTYSNAHTTARNINKLILKKEQCEICGSKLNTDIHHKNGDYTDNNLDNLVCLCRSCHNVQHRKKGICKICGLPQKALGYCNKHYIRYRKYDNPNYTKYKKI